MAHFTMEDSSSPEILSIGNSSEEHSENNSNNSKQSENPYTTVIHQWLTTPKQIYRGSLLYDNLHGSGIYFINKDDKIFYDGFFYANKMEGYCQVFYHINGSHFQGLFKENRRFGPGVLTYFDNSQDVGLWDGFSLIRVGAPPVQYIPSLSVSNEGHIKMLKYRNLVDVHPKEVPDIAEELLKNLGANQEVLNKSKKLYSKDVKNKNNLFFNKKMYDQFYPEILPTIDILIEDAISDQPSKVKIIDDETERETEEENEEEKQEIKILSRKVYLLNNQLEDIEKTLHILKREIHVVSRKIDYCNKCCVVEDEAEEKSKEELKNENEDKIEEKHMEARRITPNVSEFFDNTISLLELTTSFSVNLADLSFGHSAVLTPYATPNATSPETPESPISESIDNILKDECLCLDDMNIEDLSELEQKLKKIKKDEVFYANIYKHLNEEIDKIMRIMKSRKNIHTKKIIVNQILAWNNEPLIVDMLKHSFLHRNTEHMVNFRVPAILSGHRIGFTGPGEQERRCYEFFHECYSGVALDVIRYLREYKINVNVSDSKGNNGLFYAACNNKTDLIRILVQFGANPNQINDDGLTPLGLTILNYLARKYNIDNWETAFIPDTVVSPEDQQELKSWCPSRSFLTVTAGGKTSVQSMVKKAAHKASPINLKKSGCIFSTKFPNFTQKDHVLFNVSSNDIATDQPIITSSEICIKTLIDFGSNPNYGESVLPTFLFSIYSESFNIVRTLLDNEADPNVFTHDEHLNGLHILASSKCSEENIYIATLLIRYNCDPNSRTSQNHWIDQKQKLIADAPYRSELEDLGKNALHMLCLRTDFASDNCNFFEKMATILLQTTDITATYLRLDALRLAMVAGNLELIAHLLNLGIFDPYKNFPYEGNALTDAPYRAELEDLGKNALHMLCLRTDFASDNCNFFEKMATILLQTTDITATYLGLDALRLAMVAGNLELIAHLLNLGIFDPYKNFPYEGNALSMFFSERYKSLPEGVVKSVIELLVNKNVNPLTPFDDYDNVLDYITKTYKPVIEKEKTKGTRLSLVKGQNNFSNELEEFMKRLVIQKIFENAEMNVTNILYDFAEAKKLDNELLTHLSAYITPEKFLKNLKVLFNYGRIPSERFDKKLVENIIKYINDNTKVSKAQDQDYGSLIDGMDFRKAVQVEKKITLEPAGLDDQNHYLVCFECLKKAKNLYPCPKCQLVHFCEKKCFQANLKRKTDKHPCQVKMFQEHEDNESTGKVRGILEEWNSVKACCRKRYIKRQREEEQLKRRTQDELEKKNIYSTKSKIPQISKGVPKPSTLLTFMPKSRFSKDQMLEVSQKLRRFSSLSDKREYSDVLKEIGSPNKMKKSSKASEEHHVVLQERKPSEETYKSISQKKIEKPPKRDICPTTSTCKRDKVSNCRTPSYLNVSDILSKYPETFVSSHFEPLPDLKEPYLIKKTRKVPAKPHFFMEILSKLFPDIDLSELLLPYTCYSDGGHLYYEFNNTNLFCRNYSIM